MISLFFFRGFGAAIGCRGGGARGPAVAVDVVVTTGAGRTGEAVDAAGVGSPAVDNGSPAATRGVTGSAGWGKGPVTRALGDAADGATKARALKTEKANPSKANIVIT